MSTVKFSVAARTLIHLGAELITSDEVALNELIKNVWCQVFFANCTRLETLYVAMG